MKPWSMTTGMAVGFAVGVLLWLGAYVQGAGTFTSLKLIFGPAVIAILVVSIRNRRKKAGPYDPEVIARNRRGRV